MRTKFILGIAGSLILALFLFLWFKPKEKPIRWEAVPVRRGDLKVSVQATATVRPEHRLEIKPPLAGRAESVEVDMGTKVKQGQVLAWMSSNERAALLDAARAKGKKELAFWEDVYKAAPLVAPLDGMIISKNLVPGQVVQSTETVFVMSDRLIVQADVDETDLGKVSLDQNVEITLDGFPNIKLAGKVYKIAFDSVIVSNVSTYKIDILLNETPEFIRSGMTANVFFQIAAVENALLIPVEALQDGSRLLVSASKDGKSPQTRVVKTGLSDGKWIEVNEGIRENEFVLRRSYAPPQAGSQGLSILPRFPRRSGRM